MLISVFALFEEMILTFHRGKVNCDVINPKFGAIEQDCFNVFTLFRTQPTLLPNQQSLDILLSDVFNR